MFVAAAAAAATTGLGFSGQVRVVDYGYVVVAPALWLSGSRLGLLVSLGDHLLGQVKEKFVDAAIQLGRCVVVPGSYRSGIPGRKYRGYLIRKAWVQVLDQYNFI